VERTIGRQTAVAVEQEFGVNRDPVLAEWVNGMGQRLVGQSHRQYIEYSFKVVDTDMVNAFAAPWGYIYVTRGLMTFVDSEDEIAFILGHEVGHVANRDAIKSTKKSILFSLGAALLGAATNRTVGELGEIGAGLTLMHYSREDERDADVSGAVTSYGAGYNPAAGTDFFARLMAEEEKGGTSSIEHLFLTHPETPTRINALKKRPELNLEDPAVAKIGQHIKYDTIVLARAGVRLRGVTFDTMLASYLLDPEKHQHRLEQIAAEWLGRGMVSYEEVTEKRRGHQLRFDEVPVDRAADYSAEDAEVVMSLLEPLRRALDEAGLSSLLADLELPLSEVLVELEMTGVQVDLGKLRRLAQELTVEAGHLEEDVQRLAGRVFNLNSPKQLAEVLFDQLGLPATKKTKTGRSTDADVLEELAALHPLPAKVLQYRSLTRLVSGYLEALPALVHPETGRIHTSYNQAVAATGRLSSSNPNLQNIPVRTDVGRRIRDAFTTRPGWRIVSADYSQIELRILAHLARDPLLLESFRTGEDVHARTAREVFGVIAGGSALAEMRRRAKVINFGILYGKTDYGLARELGIPKSQARQFIADYFARYRGVKEYLDRTVAEARETGVVHTMLGRRRYLRDIRSRNPTLRNQAERMAMNTPIQGTAADLLKLAMVRVQRDLRASSLHARMLLTVHDELVFECPAEEVTELAALVRRAMEGAATLEVPLVVDIGSGETWGQAH
jgi:DNA polymerase-1